MSKENIKNESIKDTGPTDLIIKDGRPYHVIAASAMVSVETVMMAKKNNKWPSQFRTKTSLQKALGLDPAVIEVEVVHG